MNFYKYLESRFVTSQIGINKKQTTGGHGENHAILAWMWVGLKAAAVFHFVLIALHYTAVLLHLLPKPRSAIEIATAARLEMAQAQVAAQKMAAEAALPPKEDSLVSEIKAYAEKNPTDVGRRGNA